MALTGRTEIGRAPECDVSLPDPALSRVHAVIEPRGSSWHLVDRSGRGTRVGGAEVPEAALADGVEIALGAWRALFRASRGARAGGDARAGRHAAAHRRGAGGADPGAAARPRRRPRAHGAGDRRGCGGRQGSRPATRRSRIPYVSARHLRIEPRGGAWHVVDLGSTNGTFISGARVSQAQLPLGVPVSLGRRRAGSRAARRARASRARRRSRGWSPATRRCGRCSSSSSGSAPPTRR